MINNCRTLSCSYISEIRIIALLVSAFIIFPASLKSDTLILENGTLLVGKVKSKSSGTIVFKNSYGVFNIRRKEITALYETGSYNEDIEVRKKLGMDFDIAEIKNNYEAGQKELTAQEKKIIKNDEVKSPEIPLNIWIFADAAAMASIGELKEEIPYGYGGFIGFEAGESCIGNNGRNIFVPWLRVEAAYLKFIKDDLSLSGFTGGAGPVWLFPLTDNCRSNLYISLEPGLSSFRILNGNESASLLTFTFHSTFGYEYSFDKVSLFFNLRYMYVYDKDVFYNSMGVSAGVSGRLW